MLPISHSHPALSTTESRTRLYVVACVRALFLCLLVFGVDRVFDLGTSPWFIACGVALGTFAASTLSFGRLLTRGFLLITLLSIGLYFLGWILLDAVPPSLFGGTFSLTTFGLHLDLAALGFLVAVLTTWAFWRSSHALTLELLTLTAVAVYLVSGHRKLQLDKPELVNSLAWSAGWSPITTLVVIGATVVVALFGFAFFSSPAGRPQASPQTSLQSRPHLVYRDSPWSLAGLVAGLLLAGSLFIISHITLKVFSSVASGSITMMGVGQEAKEELSPLGFHSSLGRNSQPSALVRLEGDYAENPFNPMLYFRESALSGFNGKEMVLASARFDTDVNRSRPDEAYSIEPDTELLSRTPIEQSVFLLADHQTAFAIDFPLDIRQLQNPNPGRFRATYKAYSVAPGFSLQDLAGDSVGDARWDKEVLEHYLIPHPDPRYSEMAKRIVGDVTNPVAQTFLITQWFSENAIYTLTPGHEVAQDADPVAPFLFGDMRGYCVHFAHAMVYLFRSLGIPARIGTGYLTDLSQAKDGHILLRMNDRHAWAEAYISGRGWIPFDPQPQQVENHGESPVDTKLLEELMGMVGPSEEILPSEIGKDEAGLKDAPGFTLPDWQHVALPIGLALLLLAFLKVILLIGWTFAANPVTRLRLRYRSYLARLHDLGLCRLQGETRQEFRRRMVLHFNTDILSETDLLNASIYCANSLASPQSSEPPHSFARAIKSRFSWWQRAFALLSPSATIALLLRRPW